MYKTRLQELCHEKQWSFPKYSTAKDGPDHDPRFKAAVSVNGQSFHSSFPSRSSKLAQNDAAKLAFLLFTSEATAGEPTIEDPEIQSDASCLDSQTLYKREILHNNSGWKNLDPPLYASKSDGAISHAMPFKDTVTVGGHALGEAEHAAAKAALVSLSLDELQKDDSGMYKNLLQESAQCEGLSIPIYKTIKIGPCHMPTFFSTVEVKGEIFRGKGGKSKKHAELNAAKVAYSFLKQGGLSGSAAEVTCPNLVGSEPLLTRTSTLTVAKESQHNLEDDQCKLLLSPIIKYEEPAKESAVDEVQEVGSRETLLGFAEVDTEDCSSAPAELQKEEDIENNEKSFSSPRHEELMPSPALTHAKLSALPSSDPNIGRGSYLLCNRVRVYSSFPDIAFPKGITVLPISENKWVAVSLEYPNEEGK